MGKTNERYQNTETGEAVLLIYIYDEGGKNERAVVKYPDRGGSVRRMPMEDFWSSHAPAEVLT